jgi:hypothetical protein
VRDTKRRSWICYEAKESQDPAQLAADATEMQRKLNLKGLGNEKVEVTEVRCERKELLKLLDSL